MSDKTKKLKTPEEAKRDFVHRGQSIAAFAREHNLSRDIVYQVLTGKCKSNWGESHRAAVLLGLKDGVI